MKDYFEQVDLIIQSKIDKMPIKQRHRITLKGHS